MLLSFYVSPVYQPTYITHHFSLCNYCSTVQQDILTHPKVHVPPLYTFTTQSDCALLTSYTYFLMTSLKCLLLASIEIIHSYSNRCQLDASFNDNRTSTT